MSIEMEHCQYCGELMEFTGISCNEPVKCPKCGEISTVCEQWLDEEQSHIRFLEPIDYNNI
jgi:phage FluMu protein Com